jgi:hypothetical protein
MVRAALAAVALAACSGPAKPATSAAPPTRPVASIADLAGTWHATDLDGWSYLLEIRGDSYHQLIIRTATDDCRQVGKLQAFEAVYGQPYNPVNFGGKPDADAGGFVMVLQLEQNECNPDYRGAQLVTFATDFTGKEVTLRTMAGWGGAQETRRYRFMPGPHIWDDQLTGAMPPLTRSGGQPDPSRR